MQNEDPSLLQADLENARFTALVALPGRYELAGGAVDQRNQEAVPAQHRLYRSFKARRDGSAQLRLSLGDMIVAVVALPFPIPIGTLEPAMGNELMWGGAGEAFSKSKAHLLVSVMGAGKDFEISRLRAFRLTAAVAALCVLEKALGVFWTASESVIEPGRFVSVARDASEAKPPAGLWISPRFFPGSVSEDRLVCRTSGLICSPVASSNADRRLSMQVTWPVSFSVLRVTSSTPELNSRTERLSPTAEIRSGPYDIRHRVSTALPKLRC